MQLVGAATYDPHNYLGYGSMSFIPSVYMHTGKYNHHTPSDTAYVAGKDGLPKMSIGRWPVRTTEELKAVVNKTLEWKSSGQSSVHSALYIADKNDGGNKFDTQMDQMSALFENKGWSNSKKVYLPEMIISHEGDENAAVTEARDVILTELGAGASVTMFSGHSSPFGWSFKGLLRYNDISTINNTGATTLVLPLACYTTYVDSPKTNTLAHQLVAAGENGAVAVFGAVTLSKITENKILAERVIKRLLAGETLGEAVKNTKTSLGINYYDIIFNNNILGDVTLKLGK